MVEDRTARAASARAMQTALDKAMLTPVVDEEKAELRARYDDLRQAGYLWGAALRLARTPYVEVDDARRLLERGCPQDTAVRILT